MYIQITPPQMRVFKIVFFNNDYVVIGADSFEALCEAVALNSVEKNGIRCVTEILSNGKNPVVKVLGTDTFKQCLDALTKQEGL